MKCLKTLLPLILLSSSVAASAEITLWHTHFTNDRDDGGVLQVTCDSAWSEKIIVSAGTTHKCPGVARTDADNVLAFPSSDGESGLSSFGKFNHHLKSCGDTDNLLTVTATGGYLAGGDNTSTATHQCSQDTSLSGISLTD